MAKRTRKTSKPRGRAAQAAPPQPMEGEVIDSQAQFRKLTRSARVERGSERAFFASKLTMLRTHPELTEEQRRAEARLEQMFGAKTFQAFKKNSGPVPGGVGYGMFYTADSAPPSLAARRSSTRSSAASAGRQRQHLAVLDGDEPSARGVEAFVSYQGQNDTRFKVFDWARSDQWQTNIPFANLASYLRSTVSHGWGLRSCSSGTARRDRRQPLAQRGPAAQSRSEPVGSRLPVRLRVHDGRGTERLAGQLGPDRRDVPVQLPEHAVAGVPEHDADGTGCRGSMEQLGAARRQSEYDPE